MRRVIATYLATNLGQAQNDANRHGQAIGQAIQAAPSGNEEAAIAAYLEGNLGQTPADAVRHAAALWPHVQALQTQQGQRPAQTGNTAGSTQRGAPALPAQQTGGQTQGGGTQPPPLPAQQGGNTGGTTATGQTQAQTSPAFVFGQGHFDALTQGLHQLPTRTQVQGDIQAAVASVPAPAGRSNAPAWIGAGAAVATLLTLLAFLGLAPKPDNAPVLTALSTVEKNLGAKTDGVSTQIGTVETNLGAKMDAVATEQARQWTVLLAARDNSKAAADNSEKVYDATYIPSNCSKKEKDENDGACKRVVRTERRGGLNIAKFRDGIRADTRAEVQQGVRDLDGKIAGHVKGLQPTMPAGTEPATGASNGSEPPRPRTRVTVTVPAGTGHRVQVNGQDRASFTPAAAPTP